MLLGEQKQSYAFGYQLAHDLTDAKPLLDLALESLLTIEQPDSRLILGLYRGIFEKSPELWQENIDRLLADEQLVYLYPDFIRTGDIKKTHLDTLLNLIRRGVLSPNSANALSYGSVTDGIEPNVMAEFCLQLAELGHHKGEDGHYVDVAAQNAKALATELSHNIDELVPHLGLLLLGEQKQSYAFGYQLAHDLTDAKPLLDLALESLLTIEQPDSRLILGLYRGIFEKSPELWQENIDRLLADEQLVYLYPDFIRTGDIKKTHLDTLLNLIRRGVLSPNSANALSYGSVTDGIEPNVMAEFCLQLAELGDQASWSALNVIYMYCFSNKGSIEKLRDQLKLLVTAVPLHKGQEGTATDAHHWHDMAEKLLKLRDQEFAVALTHQLIAASKYGLNHGDIWSYTKPLMLNLMSDYGDTLWPIFGDAIVQAEGMERYWLQQLLDRETGLVGNMQSVLSVVPVESVIEWCSTLPDLGPVFVARCLNVLETVDEQQQPSALFVALLENFGNDQGVANELSANMGTRGWSGSLVPYLESDKSALSPLIEHENTNVRRWVKDHITYIDRQIAEESKRDEEHGFGLY